MKKRNKEENVTTMDIAEKLGLSQSTVSHILNRTPKMKFSDKTVHRVLSVADSMNYQTLSLRRAIKKSLRNLGFVITTSYNFESLFLQELLGGVFTTASSQDYIVSIAKWSPAFEVEFDLEKINKIQSATSERIHDLLASGVIDGLLIDKSRISDEQIIKLLGEKTPFVCINGRLPIEGYDIHEESYWVCIDHEYGAEISTEYLLNRGHTNIAIIVPSFSQFPPSYVPWWIHTRLDGYKKALLRAGINIRPEFIIEALPNNRSSVIDKIETLMKLPKPPTAIFADDEIATHVINSFRAAGVDVPGDISVLGYGNMTHSYFADNQLTTVNCHWREMGEIGVKKLIAIINGKDLDDHFKLIKPEIIEGKTVSSL